MYKTYLRRVGGSVMLAIPPALLDISGLRPGAKVGISIERGRLVLQPQPRPRYSLDELLAQCNSKKARTREEREWLSGKAVGAEIV